MSSCRLILLLPGPSPAPNSDGRRPPPNAGGLEGSHHHAGADGRAHQKGTCVLALGLPAGRDLCACVPAGRDLCACVPAGVHVCLLVGTCMCTSEEHVVTIDTFERWKLILLRSEHNGYLHLLPPPPVPHPSSTFPVAELWEV